MSDCDRFSELANLSADGLLSDSESAALAAHLELCPDCRRRAEAAAAMSDAFGALMADPPDTLAPGIRYKLSLEPTAQPRWRRFLPRGLTAAAACVVVLLLLWQTGSLTGDSPNDLFLADAPDSSCSPVEDSAVQNVEILQLPPQSTARSTGSDSFDMTQESAEPDVSASAEQTPKQPEEPSPPPADSGKTGADEPQEDPTPAHVSTPTPPVQVSHPPVTPPIIGSEKPGTGSDVQVSNGGVDADIPPDYAVMGIIMMEGPVPDSFSGYRTIEYEGYTFVYLPTDDFLKYAESCGGYLASNDGRLTPSAEYGVVVFSE